MNRIIMKNIIAKCGCEISATNKNKCSKCGRIFCNKHLYSYVDGNNISITKNSKSYCKKCYNEIYK